MNDQRIDADRHVIEPVTLWQTYIDANIYESYPIRVTDNSLYYIADIPVFANVVDKSSKSDSNQSSWSLQQQQEAMTPQGQLSSMDETQIVQAVIQPTIAGYIVNHSKLPAEVSLSYAQGYNHWLKDFCSFNPERLLGAALVSRHDPSNMVAQMNDIIADGFQNISLRPEVIAQKDLGHEEYHSFWQICEANNITVTIHGGNHLDGKTAGTDRFSSQFALHACAHALEIQMSFLSLLESGVLHRFPKLKFVFLEAGASWLLYWLWRLDNISYPVISEQDSKNITMKPSEYFKRQCWIAIEPGESGLRQTADIIGHEKLLFGSDYPHLDHYHIDNKEMKDKLCDFTDTEIEDILYRNASKVFEVKPPASPVIDNPATPNDETLVWHPKYNVYHQNEYVMLVSEANAFCLHFENFTFLKAVNDGLNTNQLLENAASPEQVALRIYQTKQLQTQEILIDENKAKLLQYINPVCEKCDDIKIASDHQITNLSAASGPLLDQWIEVITMAMQNHQIDSSQPIRFVLVDDYLHQDINDILSAEKHWCLIKISGEKLMISSYSNPDHPIDFNRLQQQLWQNQPVRNLAKTLFPEQNNTIPFNKAMGLSKVCLKVIGQLLNTQLASTNRTVGLFDTVTSQIEYHPINTYVDNAIDFGEQILAPIELKPCEVAFNHDGGSRHIDPAQTVETLSQLISPITGIITHLKALPETNDKPIKIYETGFFKTPSANYYDNLDNSHFVQKKLW